MSDKKKPVKNKLDSVVNKVSNAGESILTSDRSLTVLSILLGVIIWAVISVAQFPNIERKYENVPIKVDLDGSYAQSNSLEAVDVSEETATVTIRGTRAAIGNLKSSDLVAYADIDNVMMAKTYDLQMDVRASDGREFNVTSIYPSTVKVSFDKIISKEIEVEPMVDDLKTAAGYVVGDIQITPATVTVTGPQEIVNTITKAGAKLSLEQPLTSMYEGSTTELVLYKGNTVISNEKKQLTFDREQFSLNIPVYFRQTIPLSVNIINAPSNLDTEYFKSRLVFSIDELDIASPDDKIRSLETLDIGTINMREVDVGSVFEFSAENFLPQGSINMSNADKITVTCPSEGIEKKPIAIMAKDIQFVNRPASFEFTPIASGMTMYLVGDAEQIAELSSEDITAQIDLIDFDKLEGDHKMPVDFIISSYDKVWFTGGDGVATPKIYVTATKFTELPINENTEAG